MTSPSVSRRELLELAGGAAAAVAAVGCRPVPSAVEVRGREADVLTLADPLHYSSVRSLAGAISAGRVTSAEVVDNCLARIDAVNPALNAVVQLRADAARDEAREADLAVAAGEPLGPLHGVPMTIKDSLDTVDLVTTGGSQGRASFVPGRDATVVARARAAGAILLGKTNTPELTLSFETDNLVYGRTSNPWDQSRTSGGSSGGAAAIVACGGAAPAPPKKRAKTTPAAPERRARTTDSAKPCGPPEDQRLCKLVYQFLYHRATTRRLMYPSEAVVSADGKALPAAVLPKAGKDGFDHGPLIQSLCKMGNVGRGLDSGTVTMGDFVRAKLEHAGIEQGSDAWVGQAVLMCVHEMDNWLLGVNKAWTATTPEGGFRAPSTLGGLGGANFPSSREEIWSFVAFAETLWDLGKPKFAGSFQNQGKRLLKYLPARLYEIDKVVAALRAARSWKDACKAVLTLSGVGDYVGGQALCTFFFGVCKGDVSRFAPNLDATTMKSFCLCGPGPEGVVKKMWGGVQLGKSEAVKRLAWLAENAEARFQALGLRFPFQQDADGKRKRLTAVDLEHALCYFSRYLSAHDSLKAAGARIVHDKLAGPITRGECPRPSIKWFAKLKEKTAAERCDKWLADAEAGFQEAFTS